MHINYGAYNYMPIGQQGYSQTNNNSFSSLFSGFPSSNQLTGGGTQNFNIIQQFLLPAIMQLFGLGGQAAPQNQINQFDRPSDSFFGAPSYDMPVGNPYGLNPTSHHSNPYFNSHSHYQRPQVDPIRQELMQLKKMASAFLEGAVFDTEGLTTLSKKSGNAQYFETVSTVLDWGVSSGNATIKNGEFKGKSVNKVKTAQLVESSEYKEIYDGDYDIEELIAEFGNTKKKDHKDLQTTIDKKAAWHSTPYHMLQAQKYLDKALELEEFISSHNKYEDSALRDALDSLRERAELHFKIGSSTGSPITLDMDGNGKIDLTSIQDGIEFDLDGDGRKDQIAWTEVKGKNGQDTDAWLALDRNGNGQIDSGKELFGNQHGMANGYDELKKLDDNSDGVINEQDASYSELKMWQDRNGDGISQKDELMGLAESGVQEIDLSYAESKELDRFANELRQQSSFVRTEAKAADISEKQGISVQEAKSGLAIDAWLRMIRG